MLIQQAAQQYRPEDRERFVEYIRTDAMAAAQLRAPLYEDKVVDFLFDKAEVTEREVTREELQAAIEAEEASAPAPAKKKAAAKKAAPKKSAPAEGAAADEEAPPAEESLLRRRLRPKKPRQSRRPKAPAKKAAAKKPLPKSPAKKAPPRRLLRRSSAGLGGTAPAKRSSAKKAASSEWQPPLNRTPFVLSLSKHCFSLGAASRKRTK